MSDCKYSKEIIVVGGGLVGALFANFMAKRGYHVDVYEYREDMRLQKESKGRSINLALSHRGRSALACVGLEEETLKNAIPMKGRLLHLGTDQTKSVPYDRNFNQCIYSTSRKFLNEIMLTALDGFPNVNTHFNHKLISANFEEETVTFLNTKSQEVLTRSADLIVGADGAFSSLRRSMQQTPLFQFSQKYIEHGYLELSIPAENGKRMTSNHLHIWPRGEFMMIALPNINRSWTVTLFMPFSQFESLGNNPEDLLNFFKATFPDSLPLIGESSLVETFLKSEPSHLVSIKCNPYHVGTKFLLVGDAAHAMVPFYGQGMNAGFEDCIIFDDLLNKNFENFAETISEFTRVRVEDAQTICDLALYNYVEMRDLVTRTSYTARKKLDEILFEISPSHWMPLYNSVTFSRMKYKECLENRRWQDNLLKRVILGLSVTVLCGSLYFVKMRISYNF